MRRSYSLVAAPRAGVLLVALAAAGRAKGQDQSFFFHITNPVSLEQPVTEVEVWAVFDPAYYAIFRGYFSIASEADDGRFYDPRFPKPFYGNEGWVWPDGDSVTAVQAEQFSWMGFEPDTSNPVKIWSISWTTQDFTPRTVDLSLVATEFWVYYEYVNGLEVEFVPDAHGELTVVPAPGVPAILAVGLVGLYRCRR